MEENNINMESLDPDGNTRHNGAIKKPSLAQAGILYSVTVILLLVLGSKVQKREFYSGALITEFLIIALPAVIFLYAFRYDIPRVLRLNKVSWVNIFLILGAMIFAIPIVGALNLANLVLIKHIFGKVVVAQPPIASNISGLVLNILVIGGSAGLCEEILFRGTLMRAFERFGAAKSILITAFLFGLMHLDFQKLLGTFLLGALIGFMVYRTNSILSGMFAHFVNNSIAVIASFVIYKLNEIMKSSGISAAKGPGAGELDFSAILNLPKGQLIAVIISWTIIFIASAIIFTGIMYGFVKNTSNRLESTLDGTVSCKTMSFLWFLPGLAFIAIVYYAEGLKLLGVKDQFVQNIIKFLGLK